MKVAFSDAILTEYLQCITSSSKFKGGANHEYIHISLNVVFYSIGKEEFPLLLCHPSSPELPS